MADMPKFDFPNVEMPAVFREFAERSASQAKDNYDKIRSVAEQAASVFETTCTAAQKGAADYGLKLIETARTNSDAAFDFAASLLSAKSLSEWVALSSEHGRRQAEIFAAQAKELTALAQKVAVETAEPVKAGVG